MSLRADLQGDAGRELRARRVPADRRLVLLVAADQIPAAVLSSACRSRWSSWWSSAWRSRCCVLRPMIGEPIISVIMVTIGLSMFFQAAMKWIFGTNLQPFPPIFATQTVSILGLQVQTVYLMSLAVSLVHDGRLWRGSSSFATTASRCGRRRSTSRSRSRSASRSNPSSRWLGRSRRWSRRWRASWSAVVNGVSAGCRPTASRCFPAVILGGLDSIAGAVLGGIIIGLLENVAHFVDSQYLHWGNLYEIAPFYVLIVILMIRPYGLFGTKDIERIYGRSSHGHAEPPPGGRFPHQLRGRTPSSSRPSPARRAAIAAVALLCAWRRSGSQRLLAQPPDPDRLHGDRGARPEHPGRLHRARSRSATRRSSASARSRRPISAPSFACRCSSRSRWRR